MIWVLTNRKPVKFRDCVSATVTPTKEHAFYAKAVTGVKTLGRRSVGIKVGQVGRPVENLQEVF